MTAGSIVAAAFAAAVAGEGLHPPAWLRLLGHDGHDGATPEVAGPVDLGPLHERAVTAGERTQ
ncbi:MAG TPA: hypothetical protein VGE43_18880, partial [Acidimicrobiales bacterium]